MVNLREKAESDLAVTLEKDFSLPVELTGPDGIPINTRVSDGSPLVGQVLFDYVKVNPDTGQEMVVNLPVVSLRISSLSRVPKAGETWHMKIPNSPSTTATLENYIIDADRPPEGGKSIGFIKLYARRAIQS